MAFVVAPIAFGAVIFALAFFSGNISGGVWALRLSGIFGYPTGLITGISAYMLMNQRNWVGLPAYLILACIYAVVIAGVMFIWPALASFEHINLTALSLQTVVVLIGCNVTLITFWLIARPDKTYNRR